MIAAEKNDPLKRRRRVARCRHGLGRVETWGLVRRRGYSYRSRSHSCGCVEAASSVSPSRTVKLGSSNTILYVFIFLSFLVRLIYFVEMAASKKSSRRRRYYLIGSTFITIA